MTDEEPPEDSDSVPLSELRSDIEGDSESKPDEETVEESVAATPERDEQSDSTPLSRLRDSVKERTREGEAEDLGEAFFEETVDEVDTDSIWADLLMRDGTAEGQFEPIAEEQGAEGPTQIISKRICERCQYVSAPPELSCTHEGTTIHELVDVDHVRVQECPMVGPDGEKKGQGPPAADDA